ncbi:MAG: hypothetical protein ACYSRZ_02395 [Planctomycetota bacterium]
MRMIRPAGSSGGGSVSNKLLVLNLFMARRRLSQLETSLSRFGRNRGIILQRQPTGRGF